jgi:hypothetical protein
MDDFLLPLAGSRNYQLPAGVFNQGVNAGYWSSSPDNTNVHYLGFDSSSVRDYGGYRTGGLPVRCFQNASA